MKGEALSSAASWSGYRSWRPVHYARQYCGWWGEGTDEEWQTAFKKFVMHNKRYEEPPEGRYWWHSQAYMKYTCTEKVFHIYNVFEQNSYWHCCGYWDLGRLIARILALYRLGTFAEMDDAAHEKALTLLEEMCDSRMAELGNFDLIREFIQYPCFYPKDTHDRNACIILLNHINGEGYRKTIPEDTRNTEKVNLEDRGKDPEAGEELIAGWLTTKVNWSGGQQDRMIMITDRALYTFKPKYKGKGADKKHLKR